jgi:hypothetical protein
MASLEVRIQQASAACDEIMDRAAVARDQAVAEARLVWECLSFEDLVSLAIASEAWMSGRLPAMSDSREAVLEALAHAEAMRLDKSGAYGHDQVIKSLDRLAALVSHRAQKGERLLQRSESREAGD